MLMRWLVALGALALWLGSATAAAVDVTPGVPVEAASDADRAEALEQYRLGVGLLESGQPDGALQLFLASFEKVASPNSRLMVARTLAELGRHPEAFQQFQLVVQESERLAKGLPKYERTLEAARAELAALAPRVALMKLEVDGQVSVAGRVLDRSAWDDLIPMAPGKVTIRFTLNNGQTVEETVDLQAGATNQIVLDVPKRRVEPPQQMTTSSPGGESVVPYETLAWVGAGTALVGITGFTVFGLMNNGKFNDLEERCDGSSCPLSLWNDAENGRTLQTLANVSLGIGLVGAAAGAYFFLATDGDLPTSAEYESSRGKDSRVSAEVGIGLGTVQVRGSF